MVEALWYHSQVSESHKQFPLSLCLLPEWGSSDWISFRLQKDSICGFLSTSTTLSWFQLSHLSPWWLSSVFWVPDQSFVGNRSFHWSVPLNEVDYGLLVILFRTVFHMKSLVCCRPVLFTGMTDGSFWHYGCWTKNISFSLTSRVMREMMQRGPSYVEHSWREILFTVSRWNMYCEMKMNSN